jgi:hypothetical protein
VHGLATHDARRLDLHAPLLHAHERSLAVDRLAEAVHDAAYHAVADGDLQDAARGLHRLPLLDVVGLAEHDGADGLLVEVQRQPDRAVGELEHLVDGRVRQAGDAGDAVADLGDAAHRHGLDRGLEPVEVLLDRGGDVAGGDRQFCHRVSSRSFRATT